MILSRHTSSDTKSSSAAARPHLGTSFLKFKRHQDFLCSYKRTWGKYHPARRNLAFCSTAAAATVNMSLKSDAEPNNNVSIEEEVSGNNFLFAFTPPCAAVMFPVTAEEKSHGVVIPLQRQSLASRVTLCLNLLFSRRVMFHFPLEFVLKGRQRGAN